MEFIKTYAAAAINTPENIWKEIENTAHNWKHDKIPQPPTREQDNEELALYTDGSCPNNQEASKKNCPAGWGVAIYNNNNTTITAHQLFGQVITKHTDKYFLGAEYGSNNTGELTAIAEALLWLLEYEDTRKPAAIYYDSTYAAKIATGEYKAKNNKYLATKTKQLLYKVKEQRQIRLEHVKGHSNNAGNDKADEIANKGAEGKTCNKGRHYDEKRRPDEQQEQTTETNNNTEIEHVKREIIRNINIKRIIDNIIRETNLIQIPKASYGQGATRRSRFAFGKLDNAQAKHNTAIHAKELQRERENKEKEDIENTKDHLDITNNEEEEEEQNIFLNEPTPNNDDCA